MNPWVQLTIEDVLSIHQASVGAGLRDEALLSSAVQKPWTSYLGHELYPTLHDKAAALLAGIARNHSFHDGNKRTAIGACVVFLMANGHRLYFSSDEEVADFVEAVATGDLSHEHAAEWIRLHLDPSMGEQASSWDVTPQFEMWPDEEVRARVFSSTGGEATPYTPLGSASLWLSALSDRRQFQQALQTLSCDPSRWDDYSDVSDELEEFHPLSEVWESSDPDVRYVRLIRHAPQSARSLVTALVDEMYFLTMVRHSCSGYWQVWSVTLNHTPCPEEVIQGESSAFSPDGDST